MQHIRAPATSMPQEAHCEYSPPCTLAGSNVASGCPNLPCLISDSPWDTGFLDVLSKCAVHLAQALPCAGHCSTKQQSYWSEPPEKGLLPPMHITLVSLEWRPHTEICMGFSTARRLIWGNLAIVSDEMLLRHIFKLLLRGRIVLWGIQG